MEIVGLGLWRLGHCAPGGLEALIGREVSTGGGLRLLHRIGMNPDEPQELSRVPHGVGRPALASLRLRDGRMLRDVEGRLARRAGGEVVLSLKGYLDEVAGADVAALRLTALSGPGGRIQLRSGISAAARALTPAGLVAVGDLGPGDLVMTPRDGAQRLAAVGRMRTGPDLAILPAGAFGPGFPARDLLLDPAQRLEPHGGLARRRGGLTGPVAVCDLLDLGAAVPAAGEGRALCWLCLAKPGPVMVEGLPLILGAPPAMGPAPRRLH